MVNNTPESNGIPGKKTSLSPEPITTQRAYTLRLRGAAKTDHSWRDAIWKTHDAVNNGARVFGDWLLTLRGGLDHALADEPRLDAKSAQARKLIESTLKELTKAKKGQADPTETDAIAEIEDRRNTRIRHRRILLALSWLSVESSPKEHDACKNSVIATGTDSSADRNEKVVRALQAILTKRGMPDADLESWIDDCEASVSAAIRDDAVWVNRSEMFDLAQQQVGPSLTRDEVWDLLDPFFGSRESYLTPINPTDDPEDDAPAKEEKAKDLVQKAGQWLSSRFGTGKGADFSQMAKVYAAIASWAGSISSFASGADSLHALAETLAEFSPETKDANGILDLISGPGYKSATRNVIKALESRAESLSDTDLVKLKEAAAGDREKCASNTGGKGRRPWSDKVLERVESACAFTYLQQDGPARHSEFAVMLDHAARRVSIGHTWIKRAEAERQKFKTEAGKLDKVPVDIRAWLDDFCDDRSKRSGAIEAYRIRRRAIGGWREIVAKWDRSGCNTPESRIAAARELQADPDIDKFGDIQLFEVLAAEDAVIVWHVNGDATSQALLDYAAATDALAKQKRFKVPAYRHPDPLSHPVFCDFGNSRWEIRFALHDAASKLVDANATILRREGELLKVRDRVAKAKTSEKRTDAESKSKEVENDLRDARERVAWLSQRHALSMGLWDGGKLDNSIPLRWSCKRLTKDLDLQHQAGTGTALDVTRADRLGRATAGTDEKSPVHILGVFAQADWNGRLQAPRAELDAVAKLFNETHSWNDKAKKRRDRISWLVSFSAKLQQAGPWFNYSKTFSEDAPAKPFVSRNGEYAIKHVDNDKRAGQAKLILSRLPGLRLLSVDLGHRYAAACAVWETLTGEQMKSACKAAGREAEPGPDELFIHLKQSTDKIINRGQRKGQKVVEITVFRRIGADALPDGKLHPAPWARLDRQFLIKLPGEDKPVREGSDQEIWLLHQMESKFGIAVPLIDRLVQAGWGRKADRSKGQRQPERINILKTSGWTPSTESKSAFNSGKPLTSYKQSLQVDELMSSAVRTAMLSLRRHGDAARIAFGLTSDYKPMPGDRRFHFNKAQDNDHEPTKGSEEKANQRAVKHTEYLQDLLVLWYDLAVSGKWQDDDALNWWNDPQSGIVPLLKTAEFTSPDPLSAEEQKDKKKQERNEAKMMRWKTLWAELQSKPLARKTEDGEDTVDARDRKADREALWELLKPAAQRLRDDPKLRQELSNRWKNKWDRTDGPERKTSDFQHKLLYNHKTDRNKVTGSETVPRENVVNASGWHAHLRELTDWIMGRRLPGADNNDTGWRQNVGGISLTRIATMKSLYQLHKAFAMRAKPDQPRGAPEKGESNVGVGQSILDAMEQMREQRVKQIASRIAGSALGLGGHWKQVDTRRKNHDGTPRMKWVWVEESTAKYDPCHAVVIENLTNYRPDELQTRRENRQLMSWSSSKVKKYLSEACQLHGLHLREVQAGYTSRQDSRTGAPGIRCADVPVVDFMTKPWWRRQAKVAQEKADKGDARDRFLVTIEKQWSSKSDSERKLALAIRIPMNGGELFVSADPCSPAAKGLQADLNAAANVGMKALIDPDFSGKWWFIPCESATHKPHAEKTKGSFVISSELSLVPVAARDLQTPDPKTGKKQGRSKGGKKEREIVNLWRDVSGLPIDTNSPWRGTAEYWNNVRLRVISLLRKPRTPHDGEPIEAVGTPW